MRMIDYTKVNELDASDICIVDGTNGTRTITISDLLEVFITMGNLKTEDDSDNSGGNIDFDIDQNTMYDILDKCVTVTQRKNIFRGKNLGNTFNNTTQGPTIKNATFKGYFIGDYWKNGDHIFRIADMDYWFWTGNEPLVQQHHLVIVPDYTIGIGSWNTPQGTSGGYANSTLAKTCESLYNNTSSIFRTTFGSNIIQGSSNISTAASNGVVTATKWTAWHLLPMNQMMLYGAYLVSKSNDYNCFDSDNRQLALFKLCPERIEAFKAGGDSPKQYSSNYWLRDIYSSTQAIIVDKISTRIDIYGTQGQTNGRLVFGVRGI